MFQFEVPVSLAYGHVSPQTENSHQVFKDPDGPLQCKMSRDHTNVVQ